MASGPITSWQIDGETMETVTDFIFLGSKITADGDCSHEIKMLAPWKKNYDKSRQHIKRQSYFANKFCLVKATVFPVVMYRCESWTTKKAEHQRTDAFNFFVVLEKTLESPLDNRRSNWSILKEINPVYSLEGLMLKLKFNI